MDPRDKPEDDTCRDERRRMTTTSLMIETLASQGEGAADVAGTRVFVPYTLTGETVLADIDGERGALVEVTTASPDRIAPVCKHFGACGGCALQHAGSAIYSAFKRDQIAHALAQRDHGLLRHQMLLSRG